MHSVKFVIKKRSKKREVDWLIKSIFPQVEKYGMVMKKFVNLFGKKCIFNHTFMILWDEVFADFSEKSSQVKMF